MSIFDSRSTFNSNKNSKGNYPQEVLKLINEIRTKPISMVEKLDYVSAFIVSDSMGQLILSYGSSIRVGLIEGIPKFNEAKNFLLQRKPTKPLIIKEELKIDIPEDPNLWTDHKSIMELIVKKQKELIGRYNFFGFHYDYGVSNALISLVLMIVDDNKCNNRRRENIMNPNFTEIGISYRQLRKRFCSYYIFVG